MPTPFSLAARSLLPQPPTGFDPISELVRQLIHGPKVQTIAEPRSGPTGFDAALRRPRVNIQTAPQARSGVHVLQRLQGREQERLAPALFDEPYTQTQDAFVRGRYQARPDIETEYASALEELGTGEPGYEVTGGRLFHKVVYRDQNGRPKAYIDFMTDPDSAPDTPLAPELYISPDQRGGTILRGLYQAAKQAGFDFTKTPLSDDPLSEKGAKIAHALSVIQAINKGANVPDEVLAQYPGIHRLVKKAFS